jgi:hypothetical protein
VKLVAVLGVAATLALLAAWAKGPQPVLGIDWLAKFVPGRARVARWLGNGMVAFSGADHQGEPATPAGLFPVDTRTWPWRMVDPNVASFEVGSRVVVGTDNPLLRVLDVRTGAVLRRYTTSTLPLCATLLYGQSSRGTGFDLPV